MPYILPRYPDARSVVFIALSATFAALLHANASLGLERFPQTVEPLFEAIDPGQALVIEGKAIYPEGEHGWTLTINADGRARSEVSGLRNIATVFDGESVWRLEHGSLPYRLDFAEKEVWMLRNFLLAGLETRLARPGTAVDGYQVVGGTLHISRVETDRGGISFTAQDSPNREGFVFEFSGLRRRSALSSIEMVNIGNALEYRVGRIRTSNIRSPSFFDKPANTQLDHRFRPHVQPEILVRQAETGHLFVRPKLNGKDRGWFLFDSGAGFTGLNAKIARQEGFDLVGQVDQGGFGGKPISVEVYKGGNLELGPLIVDELFFQDVGEMTKASKILGEPVTGVLGWDILTRAAVEVDLRDGRLFIHDPRSYRIDPEHRAPLFLHWQVPYAEGRASGDLNGPFMLDTGAGSRGLIFPHYSVKRYGLLKGQIGKRQTSEGARGKMAMLAGELDWFEIGGHRTSPAPARFSLAEDFEADFYAIGILGGAVLEPFRLVLDYSRGEVGFVPRD